MSSLYAMYLRHRTLNLTIANLGLAAAAYILAFALRFDLRIPSPFVGVMLSQVPVLLACKGVAFWCFGLYADWWRHLSLKGLLDIIKANALGSALFLVSVVMLRGGAEGFPRSVFLLDFIIATGLLSGARLAVRVLSEAGTGQRPHRIEELALIVGAGEAGIRLLQEIQSRPRTGTAVVGFVDDDPAKIGLRVCSEPVLGAVPDLRRLVREHEATTILVAIPSASGKQMRRIVQECQAANVPYKVLPTLGELVEGRVIYTQMREVKVDDLLGREPVRLEVPKIARWLEGKSVLITGAAGSVGSELCRQVTRFRPRRIILYDRHENGLFALDTELRMGCPQLSFRPVLGDILLEDQLANTLAGEHPDVVFHAAAYKHVPIAEQNVIEAVRNNILGTRNVARAAVAHGVAEFVLISTDKAVRPTSVMGATKCIAERLIQGIQNGRCNFIGVRFGNVLASAGSVIPTFRDQIRRGGPVTVTHPEVTRYFMTIPEATQLVLQAAALGQGGDLFVLEMGEPVKIVDLARNVIRLSGFEPEEDIPIVFTGLRPGEKLFEELLGDDEELAATVFDRINILSNGKCHADIMAAVVEFERLVVAGNGVGAVQLLHRLIPSYTPSPVALGYRDVEGKHEEQPAPIQLADTAPLSANPSVA